MKLLILYAFLYLYIQIKRKLYLEKIIETEFAFKSEKNITYSPSIVLILFL